MNRFRTLQELREHLHTSGCKNCDLGFQEGLNGCCVSRGTPNNRFMILEKHQERLKILLQNPFQAQQENY